MPVLANSFEGGTSGTTVSLANSGGTSGNAFDVVNVGTATTVAFDNAHSAHGGLSCQLATAATSASAFVSWTTSMGSQAQAWFRSYFYFTANPAVQHRILNFLSGATPVGNVLLKANGTLIFTNSAGGTVLTTATAIPLGAWWRLEGFVTGDAAAGQWEFRLFTSNPDGTTPDETQTSAAAQAMGGPVTVYRFGIGANIVSTGPFWIDDIGLSSTGYLGPAAAIAPRESPPRARPLPAHRAALGARGLCAAGILAAGIAAQPGTAVPPPQPRPVITHPAPHRAAWRSVTGQARAAVPAPRQRPPQPRTPAPHAALWRARAVAPRQPLGPSRLPLPLRRPGPHRAIAGGVRGPQPAAVTGVAVPGWHPQPRFTPAHRVIWRLVTGQPPAAGIAVRAPKLIPQARHLPAVRGAWRRLAGPGNAPPPPFSVGSLTASGAPSAVLTAGGASSALTAATAPSGTLTAGTQSTGGPQ